MAPGRAAVEMPRRLVGFAPVGALRENEAHPTEIGYVITGDEVIDEDALKTIRANGLPDHENVVWIPDHVRNATS
jgi:hypothetical protein